MEPLDLAVDLRADKGGPSCDSSSLAHASRHRRTCSCCCCRPGHARAATPCLNDLTRKLRLPARGKNTVSVDNERLLSLSGAAKTPTSGTGELHDQRHLQRECRHTSQPTFPGSTASRSRHLTINACSCRASAVSTAPSATGPFAMLVALAGLSVQVRTKTESLECSYSGDQPSRPPSSSWVNLWSVTEMISFRT